MRMYTASGIGYALRPPTGLVQARKRIHNGVGRVGNGGRVKNGLRGLGQCALEDAPLGCSPSGQPWQAAGGGLANNGQYFDIITGQPLDLSNACYINDDLLVNCGDSGIGTPQPAGPITDVSQTAAYIAANAAANAAYVPPSTAPPGYTITQPNLAPPSTGTGNPLTGSNTNTTTALSPGSMVNGTSTSGSAASTCSGIGMGPCIGPLDAGTWGLIAVGALMLVMVMNK